MNVNLLTCHEFSNLCTFRMSLTKIGLKTVKVSYVIPEGITYKIGKGNIGNIIITKGTLVEEALRLDICLWVNMEC